MPRNRIRLLETIHVTQKTDRRHHKYASLLVSVLVSLMEGRSLGSIVWWRRSVKSARSLGAVRYKRAGTTGCRRFHFHFEGTRGAERTWHEGP